MKKTGLKKLDSYTEGVMSGDIDVCKWVKLAVERHYKDLEKWGVNHYDPETGEWDKPLKEDQEYYFDPAGAVDYVEFFENKLQHYEGVFKGKPIIFESWQWFCFGSVFAWLKVERLHDMAIRRFRSADYIVPKKQGKSLISGGTAIYMMDYDLWPAAQCYILAKNQSHAKELGYRAATVMVKNSHELSSKYRINKSAGDMGIYYDGNDSFYKPITSNPESEDGRNVHYCGPDETKDWTDFDIYEVMKNGTVSAPNSLMFSTTTAGNNTDSLGHYQQKYIEKVLSGVIEDETAFGIIYGLDEEDREEEDFWLKKKYWKKANPNYGISVFEDALKSMIPAAKESLNKRIAFETKHLNIWHSSNEAFLSYEKWNQCGNRTLKIKVENIKEILKPYYGMRCWAGLDLGSVSDFTAFVLVFEPKDGVQDIVPLFWIPKDTIEDRKNKSIIRPWVKEGWIFATDGDWTDHDFVEQSIIEISGLVGLQEIAYDQRGMAQIATHLTEAGLEIVPYYQGYKDMSPAIDYLESCVLQEKIEHFNNPVLTWMNSNVTVKKGPSETRLFDKTKSQDKIDGMVALAMGLYRSANFEENVSQWTEFKSI